MLFIIIAILVFGVLIAVHEFGHFTAAKLLGVRVNEFSIGMGPALLKKQGKETKYSLRLLPIGGYCSMEGEDEASEDPQAFSSQAAWKKLIILCAGAFMNFFIGFLIILILFLPGKQYTAPEIGGFLDGFPYEGENGLMVGDRIVKIDGERIYAYDDISTFLRRGDDYYYDLVIRRGGEQFKLSHFELIPQEYEYNGQKGKSFGFYLTNKNAGFFKNAELSWLKTRQFVRLVRIGLSDLIKGNASVKDLSGPVGIVSYMSEVGSSAESSKEAAYSIAFLCAFIAVNLAVMNMLPIPALDGGRVFFLIITWIAEKISRKKIDPKYEGYIHAAGLVLLLGLTAFVMFNDVIRIIHK